MQAPADKRKKEMITKTMLAATVALFGFAGAALADGGPDGSNGAPFTTMGQAQLQAAAPAEQTRSFGYPSITSRWQKTTVHSVQVPEGYGFSMGRIKPLIEVENDRLNYGGR